MSTHDLIAGYAAYTDVTELGATQGDAPAISPTTTITTSSSFCAATASAASAASVDNTIEHGC
ncbi:LxmA leader domain family RiPP [Modestobacter italicus]|uniref:LxmA leader domain family RiPP n=1 Tax=Modestobacter italicus (strain DSM 44449 / CECT 9708 / BC 501) TaxID=2732864 RepID=UPI001C977D53|nr:LxmA leader domain family RiPP [Modestobacter italicus]